MSGYTVYNEDGEIVSRMVVPYEDALLNVPAGCFLAEGLFSEAAGYFRSGSYVAYTETQAGAKSVCPNVRARWINSEMRWVDSRSIDDLRTDKMVEVKSWRDSALNTFTWGGLVFDANDTAQIRLLGLLTASKEPDFTSEMWRLADNSWVELFAADVDEVWAALKANMRYCFQRFATLEQQVANATAEQLADIRWEVPES